jgi:hypothetical protein
MTETTSTPESSTPEIPTVTTTQPSQPTEMVVPSKPIWLSKTAIGVSVASFCTLLQATGLANISDAVQGNVVDILVGIGNVAGLIYALYGRIVATHKIV